MRGPPASAAKTAAIATGGVYCWGPNGGGMPIVMTPATAPVLVEGP